MLPVVLFLGETLFLLFGKSAGEYLLKKAPVRLQSVRCLI